MFGRNGEMLADPWGDTLPLFQEAKARFINLETSITTHDEKWPDKTFHFKTHPKNVSLLKQARINFCNLANNHAMDYGLQGASDTVKSLEKAEIGWAGIGNDLKHARVCCRLLVANKHIGVVSFSDHPAEWFANDNRPGVSPLPEIGTGLSNWMSALRAELDLLIVSVHWGPNQSWLPSPEITQLAHFFVDRCGVDIVHGTSAHHVQGIELRRGKVIMYGCGDFVDDYAVDSMYRNDLGFVYFVDWDFEKRVAANVELVPTRCRGLQVTQRLSVLDRGILVAHMTDLCRSAESRIEILASGRLKVKPV